MVQQLQQQLQAKEKDAEIQRKSTELQQKVEEVQLEEADTQRLAQEQHGIGCVWLWGMHWVWHVMSCIF